MLGSLRTFLLDGARKLTLILADESHQSSCCHSEFISESPHYVVRWLSLSKPLKRCKCTFRIRVNSRSGGSTCSSFNLVATSTAPRLRGSFVARESRATFNSPISLSVFVERPKCRGVLLLCGYCCGKGVGFAHVVDDYAVAGFFAADYVVIFLCGWKFNSLLWLFYLKHDF